MISEEVGGNYFAADVNVERDSMLLLKAMYHPNWRATVDRVKTDTVMLIPSFVGVQLTPGKHQVRIEYPYRRLRMILLGLGLLLLADSPQAHQLDRPARLDGRKALVEG